MPTWGQILEELNRSEFRQPNGAPNLDALRRHYLARLSALTNRPVIVYATCFLEKDAPPNLVQINLGDIQGFMETLNGINQRELDLIITSPGGLAEATESIVAYLRTKFDHIRVFVPTVAMSAATMLALGSNEIVMGRHSQLGPIDPQFTIMTPEGPRSSPARAILDQFEQAKRECQDPQNLAAWLPILRSYAPGLLAQCEHQQEVAVRMVGQWLEKYMLSADPERTAKSAEAARWFADYQYFGSHTRRVSLDDILALGLKGTPLEAEQELQDAVLSVHHTYSHTFNQTPAVKIIENHLGRSWIKISGQILLQQPSPSPAAPNEALMPNRAERRRQGRTGR